LSTNLKHTAAWVNNADLPGIVQAAMVDQAKIVFTETGVGYVEQALREKLAGEVLRDARTYADTFLRLVAGDDIISAADPATVNPSDHQATVRGVIESLWTRVAVELLLPRI
jgi:hypothetical protein